MQRIALALVVTSSFAAAPSLGAAYYQGEIGTRALARGGANLVRPDDPSAAWLNPAALSHASGLQLYVDMNLVFLNSTFVRDCGGAPNGCAAPDEGTTREYVGTDGKTRHVYEVRGDRPKPEEGTTAGPAEPNQLGNLGTPSRFDGVGAIANQAGVQPIPRLMISFNADSLGLDGVGLGAYFFAPNNGDYSFGADTPTRYTLIDRDLLELYYGIAAAYRFGDVVAVGAGLQFVTAGLNQSVRMTGDLRGANENPNADLQIRVRGQQDFIPSGNFGVWTNPGKILGIGDLEFAGSMQLGRTVRATGPLTVEKIEPELQNDLDGGLVAFNADGATATAEFELAPFYRVGARYGNDIGQGMKFNVEADFVYEQWSVYDHVFLATNGVTIDFNPNDEIAPVELDPVVQPKDWVDAYSVRLGGTLSLFEEMLQVHGGGFYETSAIPNATYSVELVCGDKVGAGVGISGKLYGVRLDVGYSHIFIFDRVVGQESIVYNGSAGDSLFLPGNPDIRTRVAMGKYSAGFDMINVALNVGFDELFAFGKHAPQ